MHIEQLDISARAYAGHEPGHGWVGAPMPSGGAEQPLWPVRYHVAWAAGTATSIVASVIHTARIRHIFAPRVSMRVHLL